MRFEVGIQGIDKVKKLAPEIAAKLDEAEKKTVAILSQIGANILRRRLTGEDRKRRSGQLARSVATALPLRRPGGIWEGRFGYGSGLSAKYAPILEEGGTITPRSAKVLAVPIGAGLTAGGRARYSSPRQVEDGFWLSRPGLPPLFLRSVGGAGSVKRLELLFVGLPSVTIEGKESAKRAANEAQLSARAVLDQQIQIALSPVA